MDNKPSVRERLAQIGAHVTGLRNQAAVIGDAEDPIKAARKLATIGAEMNAAQIIAEQLTAQLSDDEARQARDRQAAIDAQVIALRPAERDAFLAVARDALKLEASIKNLQDVHSQLAALQAGSFVPTTADLGRSLFGAFTNWASLGLGREALLLPAALTTAQTQRAEAEANIAKFTQLRDSVKGSRELEPNERGRMVKRYDLALQRSQRDLKVLNGGEWYAVPEVIE